MEDGPFYPSFFPTAPAVPAARLLAVSILAKTHGRVGGGSVVAVDVLRNRLEVAKRYGLASRARAFQSEHP